MGVKLLFGGVDSVADPALEVAEAAGSPVELEARGEDENLVEKWNNVYFKFSFDSFSC